MTHINHQYYDADSIQISCTVRKRYSKDKAPSTAAAIDQQARDLNATVKSFETKEKQVTERQRDRETEIKRDREKSKLMQT